ncbi:hypothetical protein F5X68DRAFT_228211 [Plectosphaerella plurivora]|uniref:Uncharacterized protein n=1 Tax=Plectosphaerella plurivora TaxID=936078 RepID=A0A9P9AE18_9PEZI|nr:hypothetical protein F5X68DRAFT_228211 [Plectosphaerella plurivora]
MKRQPMSDQLPTKANESHDAHSGEVRPLDHVQHLLPLCKRLLGLIKACGVVAVALVLIFLAKSDLSKQGDEGFSLYKNSRFEECAGRSVDQATCTSIMKDWGLLPDDDWESANQTVGVDLVPWGSNRDTEAWCNIAGCLSDFQVVPSVPMPTATTSSALFVWIAVIQILAFTTYSFIKQVDFKPHAPSDCTAKTRWMWLGIITTLLSGAWWHLDVHNMEHPPARTSYGMSPLVCFMTWQAAQAFISHPLSCALHRWPTFRNVSRTVLSLGVLGQLGGIPIILLQTIFCFEHTRFYGFLEDEYTSTPRASSCTAAEIQANCDLFQYRNLGTGHELRSFAAMKAVSFAILTIIALPEMLIAIWNHITSRNFRPGASFARKSAKLNLLLSFALLGMTTFCAVRSSIFFLQTAKGEAPLVVDFGCRVVHVGISSWRHFLDVELESIPSKVARGLLGVRI